MMNIKKNRHFRTLVCLALGLVLLTGSAYANYDNANGYNLYKKGLKNFLTTENFTMEGTMEMLYNGQVVESADMLYMYDRNGAVSEFSRMVDSDGDTSMSWNQNDERIYWNDYNGNASWYTGRAWDKGFNDDYLSSSKEDREMIDKMINFMELMADTFVGDLKNNFVLASSEGGAMSYQVNLQGQQIPSVVNAGLGLIFSSQNYYGGSYSGYVTFEDYSNFADDDDLFNEYYEKGSQLLADKDHVGVVMVGNDGSITYYVTEQEYYDAIGYNFNSAFSGDIFNQLGTDPVIESANCYLTIDKDGNLTENILEGTLSGYDAAGNKHAYTIRVSMNFSDYGTTKIEPVDVNQLDGKENEFYSWDRDRAELTEEIEDEENLDADQENTDELTADSGDETAAEPVEPEAADEEEDQPASEPAADEE